MRSMQRLVCLVACLMVGCSVARGDGGIPVVQERHGLPHLFAKLRAGQPATVVYLGGSVTDGTGASDPENTSYRAIVGHWLQSTFPNKITNINAAVGGTGSDLGAFRLNRDVLSYHPDLVFVEFAVNDGGDPAVVIVRSMEGIVRQIHRANPNTDVCFIYTLAVNWLSDYKAGRLPTTSTVDELVAQYYHIPSVNVAVPAAQAIFNGTLTSNEFSGGVHPDDRGYLLYANTLIQFLQAEKDKVASVVSVPFPRPIRSDCLENARMIGPDEIGPLPSGWRIEPDDLTHRFTQLLTSDTPGAELTVPFFGQILAMYYVLGPDTGAFDYQIDQGAWRTMDPFDSFAKRYYRAHYRLLADYMENKAHTVTFRIRADHNPGSTGSVTRLGYLLVNSSH